MSRREEAARWFAKLHRGVMTLEERGEYQRWIAAKANRAAMSEMEELWGTMEGTPPPRLARKVVLAAICASLGIALLTLTSNAAFWTSLDWANR